MPTHFQRFLLSFSGGILLSLPWINFSGLFILIGFIPLLILEDYYSTEKTIRTQGLFWYSLLCFFVWNAMSTWWISYASLSGAITAVMLNSLLFTVIFYGFHISKKIAGRATGYFLLVTYWTAFEYLNLRADPLWPWLNLGNSLAAQVEFIQWYEYTGTPGGTIWILIINILLFRIIISFRNKKSVIRLLMIASGVLILPVIFSLLRYYTYKEETRPIEIAIVQPNIDPYHEKFGKLSAGEQLRIILQEASKATAHSDYIIAPETAIQGFNIENKPDTNWAIKEIRHFLKKYPETEFIIGAETARKFMPGEEKTITARRLEDDNWYERYNSALQIGENDIQIYHKSKLVMGVEKIPFLKQLRFLEKYTIRLGGSYGSLGSQENAEIFSSEKTGNKVAPVICYESAFGDFTGEFIRNRANLLFIITNDGWFGNTPGHIHHLNYARLRAIENRRSVARSANTGISAFINQRGDIVQSLGWWKRGMIAGTLNANERQTFYTKHGDYAGRYALYLSITAIVLLFLKRYIIKNKIAGI